MDYTIHTPAQLSAHLRGFRDAKGLSQAALGQLLGVNQPRIARIESDPGSVSVAQFMALLSALGVQLILSPAHSAGLKAAEAAPPPYGPSTAGEW
jgi:HTH-type transcriptional regulator / antitoxin HipB